MRPGRTVIFERSMTFAPAGMARFSPMASILLARTRMIWLERTRDASTSINLPARIAVTEMSVPPVCAKKAVAGQRNAIAAITILLGTGAFVCLAKPRELRANDTRRRGEVQCMGVVRGRD